MTADTETQPDEADVKPKRQFKFPTAFTVLFFVLVLVWILTFIIPPGTYPYVSCDGGPAKPVPGTYHSITVNRSIQERIYDLWVSPVNGLYGIRTPSEVVSDPSPELLKKGQAACGTSAGKQVPADIVTAPGDTGPCRQPARPHRSGRILLAAAGLAAALLAVGCDTAQQVPWATYNSGLQQQIDDATATANCAALSAYLAAAKQTSSAHEKATGFPNDALVSYIQAAQQVAGCPAKTG